MFTLRHPICLLLSSALAGFLSASFLLAADDETPFARQVPRLLPRMDIARPISAGTARDPLAAKLWQVVEEHESGRLTDAIKSWVEMRLPPEGEVWRSLGLGVASFYSDDLSTAANHFATAQALDADNAAVHYFNGLLQMTIADRAADRSGAAASNDADEAGDLALSKSQIREVRLTAILEFEQAVQLASRFDTRAALAPIRWVVQTPYPLAQPVAPPAVADLLNSFNADNFVGKSHALLVHLCLDLKQPDRAETHMDAAVRCEVPVPLGYRLIGQQYQTQGHEVDALRAFLKAMKQGDQLARPGATAIENLGETFRELL